MFTPLSMSSLSVQTALVPFLAVRSYSRTRSHKSDSHNEYRCFSLLPPQDPPASVVVAVVCKMFIAIIDFRGFSLLIWKDSMRCLFLEMFTRVYLFS